MRRRAVTWQVTRARDPRRRLEPGRVARREARRLGPVDPPKPPQILGPRSLPKSSTMARARPLAADEPVWDAPSSRRVAGSSFARPLAAAVGIMLILVALRPPHVAPPALALVALANSSASIDRDAAKYVSALLVEIADKLSGTTVDCAIDFAFCGRSSCTRPRG